MSQPWRLIPEITASGATHMAIDTWLLDQLIAGTAPPTLRFYRWSPAAISLGYHQKYWPPHWHILSWKNQPVDIVRRPTGGRAVLHQGDFTYAIAMPVAGHSRQDRYRQVCDALIAAWQRLGIQLDYGTSKSNYRNQPNCFALSTPADLVTATGYKLIGNAQLRQGRCLLQQGTMRLSPDQQLYREVFGPGLDAAPPPEELSTLLGQNRLQKLAELMAQALEQQLKVRFETRPITPEEQQAACQQYAQQTIP